MPPILSIVGTSNSGKTSLIERLIPVLIQRGYQIGTVKHTHHRIDVDREGKDSARHRAAGAQTAIVASTDTIAMVRSGNGDRIENLTRYLDGVDLVITEGYKTGQRPKIEVCRRNNRQPPLGLTDGTVIAFVSDTDYDLGVPKFGLGDIEPLADLIEKRLLCGSST